MASQQQKQTSQDTIKMSKNEDKVIWTRDETWSLIKLLENKEILWNFTLKDYQNKVKREAAFAEVAEAINSKSVAEVKKKIHALRSQHCGERMKMKKRKSGSGTDDIYKPKWEFFNALNFMFKDAGSAGSVVDSMENANTEIGGDNGASALVSSPFDVGTDDDTVFAVPESRIPAKPNKSKRKREKQEDPHLQLAYSILKAPIEKEDSTALFGKYIAEKLNQFDPLTKAILTHKINNLIFEAEMSTIGNQGIPGGSQSTSSSPSPVYNSSPSPSPLPQDTTTLDEEITEFLIVEH